MNECWKNIIITKISVAIYVAPDTGKTVHQNRQFHGFVLNDADSIKDYVFDDGFVLHTKGSSLFYLPKGSSYCVITHSSGGCYAINFDAEICDTPFCYSLRNTESVSHNFKLACEAWKNNNIHANILAMRALYDGVYQIQKEQKKQYVPTSRLSLIAPGVNEIDCSFTKNDISISSLAAMCGISEVYFRKLFFNAFGISPKEYIIQKRIEYAKTLLSSGDFSVSEVAIITGYSEPCHFSREFSKRVGISPKQYKNL